MVEKLEDVLCKGHMAAVGTKRQLEAHRAASVFLYAVSDLQDLGKFAILINATSQWAKFRAWIAFKH